MGYWPCKECKGRGHFGWLPRWRWLLALPIRRERFYGRCPRCNGDRHAQPPIVKACPLCGATRERELDNCEQCGWERPISPPPPPRRY